LFLAWALCGAAVAADSPRVGLKEIAAGFVQPTVLVELRESPRRLLIADQVGVVKVLSEGGGLDATPFLDLTSRTVKLNQGFDERGLLGLVLHPKFPKVRKIYACYSAPLRSGGPAEWDHTSRVSEFTVTAGPKPVADLASERVVLEIDEPYFNHNSGRLAFGPDGYLYIASGDGGNQNDVGRGHSPSGNGQDKNTLLGKILRIDVDRGQPYGIPRDNPFVKGGGRPEIWAYGLRNPWGMSFDRGGKRELFAADVGQTLYEEINLITKGGNYGWSLCEGSVGFNPASNKVALAVAPKTGAGGERLIEPIVAYKNVNGFPKDPGTVGISVTGGYVYRGKAMPALRGKYVFADWSSHWALPRGMILVATPPARGQQGPWSLAKAEIASHPKGLGGYIVAMAEDESGELYALTNDTNALIGNKGKVYKLGPP
jgi:glucose/arabinose dehydrogenase